MSLKKILLLTFFLHSMGIFAAEDISSYPSKDNLGLKKIERIDSLEAFIDKLAKKIQDLNAQLEASNSKIKNLENSNKSLLDANKLFELKFAEKEKKTTDKKDQKTSEKGESDKAEVLFTKEDFEAFKKNEFEKMKADLLRLKARFDDLELSKSTIK